ncbi:hypothetical protein EW026_g1684 [Hermanssonia centrifuga]|uniref:Protein kinase domain-containing protein n=1 Tax=Hermanssonia centrifuga TaxID=98765 RepID=A0A4S4KQP7_9APHY|nr:hypothetical protein EW026_g1684 [Hermanssonia centrifuga]
MEIPANSWGVQTLRSSHYFPQFLWKFLLSNIGPKWIGGHRIHVYDVVDDGLVEARRIPHQKSVFCDFDNGHLDLECLTALDQAEKAFARLEDAAETALTKILRKLTVAPGEVPKRQTITLERHDEEALRRYLIFLSDGSCDGSYHLFFPITPTVSIYLMIETPSLNEIRSTVSKGKFFMVIDQDLKRKRDEAEDDLKSAKNVKRIKIVQEPLSQEKIPQSSEICTMLPNLDFNDCFSDSESTVVTESDIQAPPSEKSSTNPPPAVLCCDVESVPDVHLRNAMLLRDTPRYLLFSSLLSMTTAITVYDPARSDAEHTDLSALKLHCRQKHIREGLRKTLVLAQIASGVAYLHNCKPVVIHGDLKGNNILIDDGGMAVIADFGMAKVLEDFESDTLAASVFGGATRWLAPEIVKALMEDDGGPPPYTMQTDVYAFASVCLEIATGKLPYSHRTNAYAVGLDKLRGVKPCREDPVQLYGMDSRFWTMLERCWDEWYLRPSMSELTLFLGGLI